MFFNLLTWGLENVNGLLEQQVGWAFLESFVFSILGDNFIAPRLFIQDVWGARPRIGQCYVNCRYWQASTFSLEKKVKWLTSGGEKPEGSLAHTHAILIKSILEVYFCSHLLCGTAPPWILKKCHCWLLENWCQYHFCKWWSTYFFRTFIDFRFSSD